MVATIQPKKNMAGEMVWIETNGFIVRSVVPADVTPQMIDWFNSPELLGGLNLSSLHFNAEKMKRFVSGFDNAKGYFMGIFQPNKAEMVGFYTMDVNPVHKTANMTAGISAAAGIHSKTVLWKTIDALLDHFFEFRDVAKVTSRVLATNRRMLFNFMGIGNNRFAYEGRLYKECMSIDGNRVDVLMFSAMQDPSDLQKIGKAMNER